MDISVTIEALREATQQAGGTIDKSTTTETGWLYLMGKNGSQNRVYLYSTNMASQTLVKIPAKVATEGEVLIRHELLDAFLANLPGGEKVRLSMDRTGNWLEVEFGSSKSRLSVFAGAKSAAGRVKGLPFDSKPQLTVSAERLHSLFQRIQFCAATEVTHPLSSVRFFADQGEVNAIACDQVVAGKVSMLDDEMKVSSFELLLPQRSLTPLVRMLSKRKDQRVQVFTRAGTVDPKPVEAFFRFKDVIYGGRLSAMPWSASLGQLFETIKPEHRFEIDRDEFKMILGRAIPFSKEQNRVVLSFDKKKLSVAAQSSLGSFQDVMSVEGPEAKVRVAMSMAHLSNVVGAFKGTSFSLRTSGEKSAAVLADTEDHLNPAVYVISPIAMR